MPALIDLTGKKFGRLTILKRNKEIQQQRNDREPWWDCICDCGNNFSARGHDLRDNKILSCGCLKKENARNINYKDLTNQQFGKLTVLKEIPDKRKSNRIIWLCQCDCGNTTKATVSALRSGNITSCGCIHHSQGVEFLKQKLLELNIKYETEKWFNDLRSDNKKPLQFDFYLPDLNILIEFDGEQHYKKIDIFHKDNLNMIV